MWYNRGLWYLENRIEKTSNLVGEISIRERQTYHEKSLLFI